MNSVAGIDGGNLVAIVGRIERLEEEKSGLSEGVRDVYLEAKSQGFDPKIIRKIVQERKKDQHVIDEEETMLSLYRQVLGSAPKVV